MKFSGTIRRALALAVLTLVAQAAYGQISNATLSGVVSDPSAAAVPAASVTAKHVETNRPFTATTDASGRYTFLTLPVGQYELTVEAAGFKQAQRLIQLTVNQAANLNLTLEVGQKTEVVNVVDQAPLVNATNSTVGTVIETRAIFDLPLNGRNFTQLISLTPGVSTVDSSQGGAGPSIQGQRNRDNSYVADGVSISRISFGNVVLSPPVDAIQEFRVQSVNADAELGGGGGGFINLVTKSGTDKLHGTAYDYLRNNVLDARNTFQPTIPAFRQNQFGFSVGGPVVLPKVYNGKSKTWFFASYEGFRRRQASSGLSRVPTDAQRAGNFAGFSTIYDPFTTRRDPANASRWLRDPFPANAIPASQINKTAAQYSKELLPLPNYSLPGTVNNFLNTAPSTNDTDTILARIDHTISSKDRISARWLQNDGTSGSTLPVGNNLTSGNFTGPRNLSVEYTRTLTPTSLVTARYGFARASLIGASARLPEFYAASGWSNPDGFPLNDPAIVLAPAVGIATYGTFLGQNYSPEDIDSHTGSLDYSLIVGKHTFKGGFSLNRFSSFNGGLNPALSFGLPQTQDLASPAGTGDGYASFLLGTPNSAGRAIGLPLIYVDGNFYGAYVQDTIRLTSRLSLNLGLRWDFSGAFPTDGVLGSFDQRGGGWLLTAPVNIPGVVYQGPNVRQGIFDPDYNNFGPRAGVAYTLFKRTVLRAGYSMSYDLIAGRWQFVQNPRVTWPRGEFMTTPALNIDVMNRTLEKPFVGLPSDPFRPDPFKDSNGNATLVSGAHNQPHFPIPFVHQWNFALEQQMSDTLVLSATYVGSAGRKLECCGIINQSYENNATAFQNKARPYMKMNTFRTNRNDGYSDYHSLQMKADQRFSKGFSYLVSYTWSKATDLACSGYIGAEGCHITQPYFPAPYLYGMDHGAADFDLRHVASASFVYELPFGKGKRFAVNNTALNLIVGGWQASGIISLRSGVALTPVVNNSAQTNVGSGVQPRPDVVGSIAASKQDRYQWFNTAAFSQPAGFSYGTAGKNILRGPRSHNEDLSLFKNFPLAGESLRLQFRADLFNAVNATRFGNPGVTQGTPTFGQISSAASGRVVQFALKVIF